MNRMLILTVTLVAIFLGSGLRAQNNFLDFDGINDHVVVPHNSSLDITRDITIEAWVRTTKLGDQYIVEKNSFYVRILGGQVGFWIDLSATGWLYSSVSVADGDWHHVACVRQGNEKLIYVDGVLSASSGTANIDNRINLVSMNIGNRYGTNNFLGQMDEIRIWNYARSTTELNANFFSSFSGTESGLVAYYNFNQGVCGGDNSALTAPELTDLTGSNSGNLINFDENGCVSNFVCADTDCGYPAYDPSPAPIPTLSQWGLIILFLTFTCVGSVVIFRRKRAETKIWI